MNSITGGRKLGSLNKATLDVKEILARLYTEEVQDSVLPRASKVTRFRFTIDASFSSGYKDKTTCPVTAARHGDGKLAFEP